MTKKYRLIAIDGTIVETFNSSYSAQNFRAWYYKLVGEMLEIQEMKETIKPNKCIICKIEFFTKSSAKSQRGINLRQGNCITCSRKCSRIYTRNRIKILKKTKLDFWATKKIKKLTIVRFRRADGTIAKFRATKIIQKPKKIKFYFKKKRYKK